MAEFRVVYMLALWTAIGLLTLVFVLSAFKVELIIADECQKDAVAQAQICATSQRTITFTLLWQIFMVASLTLGGVLMLRQYRNQTMLGFFVGVSFAMANWMLCKSITYGSYVLSQEGLSDAAQDKKSPEVAAGFRLYVKLAALCSVLLTIAYGIFGILIVNFRETITEGKRSPDVEREEEELDAPSRRTSTAGSISLVTSSSFGSAPASAAFASPSKPKAASPSAVVVALDQV